MENGRYMDDLPTLTSKTVLIFHSNVNKQIGLWYLWYIYIYGIYIYIYKWYIYIYGINIYGIYGSII